MEIIKIGDEALKITLSAREADIYDLNTDEIDYDDSSTIGTFKKLLIKAREEVGFEFVQGKAFVQIYQSKDGGCEIFISCLEVEEEMYKDKVMPPDIKKSRMCTALFRFDSLEALLGASQRIENSGYSGKSSVYHDSKKEQYYLAMEDMTPKDLKYAFIGEYAKQIKGSYLLYIKEHFKCICKRDGTKILSKLL